MRAALAVGCVASLAAAAWLLVDNRRLRTELLETRATAVPAPAPEPEHEHEQAAAANRDTPRTSRGGAALLGFVGRTLAGPPPATAEAQPSEELRRDRRQKKLRDLLGRSPGETEEQYRARVAPLVQIALIRPRQRAEEKRQEFETAAELTPEQRGDLDRALSDARAELIGLASKAVTAGEITPYRRNTVGLLNFVGGAAGIADGFDARMRQILGNDQQGLLEDTGFDFVEYLGFTTPWESVTPPPPAPNL